MSEAPTSKSTRRPYPSDLTDEEWEILEPIIPRPIAHPNLQVPVHSTRELMNAIRYRTRTGCSWRSLPHDFPPWSTVQGTYRKWLKTGVMKDIHDELRERARIREGRKAEPTAAILDSQSVKGSAQGGEYGYDAGKKVKGRKRHIVVDALGLILAISVTSASVQDRDGAVPVVKQVALEHSTVRKLWADGAYTGEIIQDLREQTDIDIEVVKRTDDVSGFVVVPRRWVVERTFGWMERFRLLSREVERSIASSREDVFHAMVMVLLRRITAGTHRFA
jgi:putative transposase